MIKVENTTETYWYQGGWFVDIVTTPEEYKAYLYNKEYCIKSLIFGVPKKQQRYQTFLQMVELSVDEHIQYYIEDYFEKDN